MLGLKLPTDPHWANIAESNLEEILIDHAWCEQKATTNAISIIVSYPEFTDMVNELLIIAKEELSHFEMVHEKIKARGFKLGPERKDSYVNELYKFMRKGFRREIVLMDRLLFSAMIEARSCERFKVLSENINDKELAGFYRELMISEAGHYTTFIQLAKKHLNPEEVDKRWKEWLEHESKVIANYGKGETIHG
jgi:tRNA-(ms[2]io[6]A)-hydroxylase